ncbi:WecB/TagA/CpsF family glycosyltransferase [Plesiomonas shigelloides]|uniref:WecB/TagA/CpsF family glycosyltransferase n=1 Tax=Plesiomonas shigelloides TaxID=703 RepID=UPI00387F0F93
MNNIKLFGLEIFYGDLVNLVNGALESKHSLVINTINPHSYVVQKSDMCFKAALVESDYLIPDGSGIVLAAKLICGQRISKIAGYDLFETSMAALNETGGSVFFLGSTELVLSKIADKAKADYPNVNVNSFSPPFKTVFDEADIDLFCEKINSVDPDVVFVGLTAPKQEKLISRLRDKTNPKFFSGIGAVFDFYAGTVKRPNKLWIHLHLEWLVRFLGEPKRLWRRNFISTPIFIKDMAVDAIHSKIKFSKNNGS